MIFRRGNIFFVEYADGTIGSEQKAGRPAIIVSNNRINRRSDVLEVVYVTIKSTGVSSTALCEQVHSVSRQRFGSYFEKCTPGELKRIDEALLISLGITRKNFLFSIFSYQK